MQNSLLIVGASGRAAAASALRGGFTPHVLDLFADADTQQLCEVRTCPLAEYPRRLPELCRQFPPMPWMYTGGLENHPQVIADISRERELLGCDPSLFGKHRSPVAFHALLSVGGFRTPAIATGPDFYFPNKELPWLVKHSSSGGFGVRHAKKADFEALPPGAVRQRFVTGASMSAVFLGATHSVELFGVTRQLIGEAWLHAPEFRYAGNISVTNSMPLPLLEELQQLADYLRKQANLLGIWGIDFILAQGEAWYLELNPRFPASAEVLEQGRATSAVALHVESCLNGYAPNPPPCPADFYGKAVYYAKHPVCFPESGPWTEQGEENGFWPFADIPVPGTQINTGEPVLTLRAAGRSERDCESKLHSLALRMDAHV